MFKRLLSSILILSSFVFPAYAEDYDFENTTYKYSDVEEGQLYEAAIQYTSAAGLTVGYADNTFGYNTRINRAELTKMIVAINFLYEEDDSVLDNFQNGGCFNDVEADDWFAKYVCYAKDQGWVNGYSDGSFRPWESINFVEAMKIVLKASKTEYNENSSPWYKGVVDAASSYNGIPLSIDSFGKLVSRSEVADIITRRSISVLDKDIFENLYLGTDKNCLQTNYSSILDGIKMSYFLNNCDAAKTEENYKIDILAYTVEEQDESRAVATIYINDLYLDQGQFYEINCTDLSTGQLYESPYQYPKALYWFNKDQHLSCYFSLLDQHKADENNHLIQDLYKSDTFILEFMNNTL